MLSLDIWLHHQLREQRWKGPTAVSAYLSLPVQLIGIALSATRSARALASMESFCPASPVF